ncbi:MAG: hypothetical protein WC401_10140 [Bacteroidales bacterium]
MTTELNELSKEIHEYAQDKGFWDNPRETGTLLMLIVSELAEALEADRKIKYALPKEFKKNVDLGGNWHTNFEVYIKDTFEDEIADTFIRLFDLCGAMNIDIEYHINQKLVYNASREYRHGKKY